jgi:hypothetical protein
VGAAPPATGGTTNGDRPSPRAASGIAWPPLAGTGTRRRRAGRRVLSEQERIQRAEDEYFARLRDRADRWLALNPDRATELEAEERAALGFRTSGELTAVQRTALRENVVERVREEKKWPSCREWMELERERLAATAAA